MDLSLKERFKLTLKVLRAHQWIKNIFMFIPLIFSGEFLDINQVFLCVMAVVSFSFIASNVYVFNDIIDIESDRQHPKKKNRPLASGKVSLLKAMILATLLGFTAIFIATYINFAFLTVLGVYIMLNLVYTYFAKHQPIWDILLLSSFYIIRVLAGAYAISVPLSSWLLLTTFFAALFLSSGKRYIELITFGEKSRKVLSKYSPDFIKYALNLSSFCTILFYSIYTTTKSFYFELSVVLVVSGFLMYFYSLYNGNIAEDPVMALLKNKSLLLVCAVWAIYLMVLLKFGL